MVHGAVHGAVHGKERVSLPHCAAARLKTKLETNPKTPFTQKVSFNAVILSAKPYLNFRVKEPSPS
jgi:hypothetical protein